MTAKRLRRIAIAAVIFVAGLVTRSVLVRTPPGAYGRLFDSELPAPPQHVVTRTVPVVSEAPAPPATNNDPLLGVPAAAESAPVSPAAPLPQPQVPTGADVQIVGDQNGVAIVNGGTEPPRSEPKLRGGIFK